MNSTNLDSALETRVKTLGLRIATLKRTMHEDVDSARIQKLGELHELERRNKDLEGQLHQIGLKGSGIWDDANANLRLLADNIQGGIDSILLSIDAHYSADKYAEHGRGG